MRLTFPNDKTAPSEFGKQADRLFVTLDVAGEFCPPELDSRLRHGRSATAGVTVPEAPVDEQRRSMLRKDEVRRSRQVGSMEAEAISERMGRAADSKFGGCILPPHPGHHGGAIQVLTGSLVHLPAS